jgi:hypothetical protein
MKVYRIRAIFKVETDIITSIAASMIERVGILVIMLFEILKTDVNVFIGNDIMYMYMTSHWLIILSIKSQFFDTDSDNITRWDTCIRKNVHITNKAQKKICVFTVNRPTLSIFTQNSDNHFCCLISSNVLFIQPLAFCQNWEQRR